MNKKLNTETSINESTDEDTYETHLILRFRNRYNQNNIQNYNSICIVIKIIFKIFN